MERQKIVIVVEGGCVREVYAWSRDIECQLIDLDEDEDEARDFEAEIAEATKDLVPVF